MGLDRTDIAILQQLQNNARLTNKRIAEKVGVAPSTCLERIRRMQISGVIRGYYPSLDLGAVGRPLQALIAVRLVKHSNRDVATFRQHVLGLSDVINLFHVAGANDFLLHVAVANSDALRDFALDNLTQRPEVAHVETSLIFDHHASQLSLDEAVAAP